MGFSFVRAAVVCAVLERISWRHHLKQLLLKLVTVPSFCSFTFISLWMPLALFFISLVFSALVSILGIQQVLSRLSTWASNSCSSSARPSMLSVYCQLVISLPPTLIFPSCSSRPSVLRNEMHHKGFVKINTSINCG